MANIDFSNVIRVKIPEGELSAIAIEGTTVWTAKYTVKFYNESTLLATVTVNAGDTVSSLPSTPTREGYKFDYWEITSGGSGQFTTATKVYDDLIVKAHWTVRGTYTLKITAGLGSGTEKTYTYYVDENMIAPANPFSYTYHTFNCWQSLEDLSHYTAGSAYPPLTTISGKTITWEALWTDDTYTVTYSANASDATGIMSNDTAKCSGHTLKYCNFLREDFNFARWYGSNGSYYTNHATIPGGTISKGGQLDLSAIWSQAHYNVVFFDTKGGNITATKTYKRGVHHHLPVRALSVNWTIPEGKIIDYLGCSDKWTYSFGEEIYNLAPKNNSVSMWPVYKDKPTETAKFHFECTRGISKIKLSYTNSSGTTTSETVSMASYPYYLDGRNGAYSFYGDRTVATGSVTIEILEYFNNYYQPDDFSGNKKTYVVTGDTRVHVIARLTTMQSKSFSGSSSVTGWFIGGSLSYTPNTYGSNPYASETMSLNSGYLELVVLDRRGADLQDSDPVYQLIWDSTTAMSLYYNGATVLKGNGSYGVTGLPRYNQIAISQYVTAGSSNNYYYWSLPTDRWEYSYTNPTYYFVTYKNNATNVQERYVEGDDEQWYAEEFTYGTVYFLQVGTVGSSTPFNVAWPCNAKYQQDFPDAQTTSSLMELYHTYYDEDLETTYTYTLNGIFAGYPSAAAHYNQMYKGRWYTDSKSPPSGTTISDPKIASYTNMYNSDARVNWLTKDNWNQFKAAVMTNYSSTSVTMRPLYPSIKCETQYH